jgi:hypothetical protein
VGHDNNADHRLLRFPHVSSPFFDVLRVAAGEGTVNANIEPGTEPQNTN